MQSKSCVRGQQAAAQQRQDMPHANKLSRLVVVAAAYKGAASGAGQLRTAAPAKQGHTLAIPHLVEPPEAGSMAAQGHPELPAQHVALLNHRFAASPEKAVGSGYCTIALARKANQAQWSKTTKFGLHYKDRVAFDTT